MDRLDLSFFFTTRSEARNFSSRLSNISEKVYHTGFNLETILADEFGLQKKEKFITLLRDNKINTGSNSDLTTFFSKIIEMISSLPVLSITIAFEPKENTLTNLSQWFILNLNRQVLFDIQVDRKLIAGAVLNYKGAFMDFSIRPQLEQILARKIVAV